MSVRLMGAVFDLEIPATEKLVLLALADHARDDGTGAYPSIRTLAKKTSLTRRGVQKVVQKVLAKGLIIDTGKTSRYQTIEYTIDLSGGEQGSLPLRTESRPGGRTKRPKAGEQGSPESKTYPGPSEPKTEPAAPILNQAKIHRVESSETAEQSERQLSEDLKATAKAKSFPSGSRPKDPLRAELYDGIFRKKIADVFFDLRNAPTSVQLVACVHEAVTSLVLNRIGKMMSIDADELENLALQRLDLVSAALESIKSYERRRDQVVVCVTSSVVATAAGMLEALQTSVAGAKTSAAFAGPESHSRPREVVQC